MNLSIFAENSNAVFWGEMVIPNLNPSMFCVLREIVQTYRLDLRQSPLKWEQYPIEFANCSFKTEIIFSNL